MELNKAQTLTGSTYVDVTQADGTIVSTHVVSYGANNLDDRLDVNMTVFRKDLYEANKDQIEADRAEFWAAAYAIID